MIEVLRWVLYYYLSGKLVSKFTMCIFLNTFVLHKMIITVATGDSFYPEPPSGLIQPWIIERINHSWLS